MGMRREPERVLGHQIAEPRITTRGLILIATRAGGPVLALFLVLDVLLGAVVQATTGVCVALWCWLW